jgi:hypothetical protein
MAWNRGKTSRLPRISEDLLSLIAPETSFKRDFRPRIRHDATVLRPVWGTLRCTLVRATSIEPLDFHNFRRKGAAKTKPSTGRFEAQLSRQESPKWPLASDCCDGF